MKDLFNIEDRMMDELCDICNKDNFTPEDIKMMYQMVDIVKDIETIAAMKDYSSDYSEANRRGYSETWPTMPRTRYSNARGRDSMGRYTSRNSSYSGHDSKEDVLEDLNRMMMESRNDEERERFRRAIEQLNR